MVVVVAYDVNTETKEGQKRLRRVAKLCVNYGQRVQNSVFEILIDYAKWIALKAQLEAEIDPSKDSLRYYFLGKNWKRKVESYGVDRTYDPEGFLMI